MADENQLLHLENRIQNEYSILEYLDIRGDTTQVVSDRCDASHVYNVYIIRNSVRAELTNPHVLTLENM